LGQKELAVMLLQPTYLLLCFFGIFAVASIILVKVSRTKGTANDAEDDSARRKREFLRTINTPALQAPKDLWNN
jgi:hypothetical protein